MDKIIIEQDQCAVCPICIEEIKPNQQWVYTPDEKNCIIIHSLHFGLPIDTREEYLALQKTPELWSRYQKS